MGSAGSGEDTLPAPTAGADHPELPVIDRANYTFFGEVARGGMGRILNARDRRLARPVAIKELLHADPLAVARFAREVRITARLQHPAIVHVLEAGVWPSGEPFYAMVLVRGRPLDQVIDAAATLADRLALLPTAIAVADALAYAHGEGVIHRDLKPGNVLCGAYGETVVIDWGLAKALNEPEPELTRAATRHSDAKRLTVAKQPRAIAGPKAPQPEPEPESAEPDAAVPRVPSATVDGTVLGTPAYMPPEQAAGDPVAAPADVYALGALLYHLLAGVPPYRGATTAEVSARCSTVHRATSLTTRPACRRR